MVVSVKRKLYFCTNNQKKVATMDEKERHQLMLRRALLFQQIHLTVLFEDDFIAKLGKRGVLDLQDDILDEIIFTDKKLGLRI